MPKTIKYIGTQERWPELAITGRPSAWNPGWVDQRSDVEAAQLLATGLFFDVDASRLVDDEAVAISALVSGAGSPARRRAQARFASKYVAGVSRLIVAGDSYAVGAGASVAATTSFAALLGTRYTGKLVMGSYGFAGQPIHGYTQGALQFGVGTTPASRIAIEPGDVTLGIFGLNDLRGAGIDGATNGAGPNPSNYADLRARVMAMALTFLVPETAKKRSTNAAQTAGNPALTFSGVWSWNPVGNVSQMYTAVNGASVSGTTAAGDLLIIRYAVNSSADAAITFSVTVDGAAVGSFGVRSAYDANWTQFCLLVPLATSGTHTFTLAKIAGDGLLVESVDCVLTKPGSDFSATLIYAPPLYLNDSASVGWNVAPNFNSATAASATGALAWNYGNGAAERFGAAVDDAMTYLSSLGFNIVRANVLASWNVNTMLAADTLHPNDRGHLHIAQRFAAELDYLIP
jgi:hypothetical protein